MNVLITSIGSTTSIGVVKFIKAIEREITIIGSDTNCFDRIAGASLVDKFFKVPANKDRDYLKKMLEIVDGNKIDILIPVHDDEIETIGDEIKKFEELGCKVVVSHPDTVKGVNNKYLFAQHLKQANILTPKTYSAKEWIKEDFNENKLWILKPVRGVSSRGIYKKTTEEIREWIDIKNNLEEDYIIQELVSGKEFTVDVFVKDKRALCIVPRVRDEIREGLCYKSYTVPNESFVSSVNEIIKLYDFYGPINIQFMGDQDAELYCIECNPRFGGSSVNTLYAGINLFQFIIDDFEEKPMSVRNDYRKVFMTRYWEEVVYEL